jgi:tetratricopeptide (TPR) repeat protein
MRRLILSALLLAGAGRAGAQQSAYDRAFDLERRGSFAAAVEAYREALRASPSDVNVVLGLERVLDELGRSPEMAPPASAALATDPTNPVLYGVAVRSWMAAGQIDSVRRLVTAWSALEPGSESPFREWGFAALARRDRGAARQAYLAGRVQLGRPDAMAGELAQLATIEADYPVAAAEWRNAVTAIPAYRASALGMLSQVPEPRRATVLEALTRQSDPVSNGLAASLLVRWGDPVAGFRRLAKGLPPGDEGARLLAEFLEELRPLGTMEAALARGQCLEALADRGGQAGPRYLAEAARAYSEAGDQVAARRMLSRIAGDPASAPGVAAEAGLTLVNVLIAEGQLEEADRRLSDLRGTIAVEDYDRLRHALALGLLRAGRLDRAEVLVAQDSSVEGLAVRGRVMLLRGNLRRAAEDLAAAGPYAIDREDATARASLLALLQTVDGDSIPAVGLAFLALERRDSAGAVRRFESAAEALPLERGGAALLLIAGRVAADLGDMGEADRLLQRAGAATGTAPAAAAQLERARLMASGGRPAEAVAVLEQLILDQPGSAVAPQARHLLEVIRGGVPPS